MAMSFLTKAEYTLFLIFQVSLLNVPTLKAIAQLIVWRKAYNLRGCKEAKSKFLTAQPA